MIKHKSDPIEEARRYMANARQILSEKAGKEDEMYSDKKYVKMAGHTAWMGVLYALDAALQTDRHKKKNERVDISFYLNLLSKADKKMSQELIYAYDGLHKAMGYDGIQKYKVVSDFLKSGNSIIDWCEKRLQKMKKIG